MKAKIAAILKIAKYIAIIAILVGGFTFVARNEKLKSVLTSFNNERDAYRTHHRPVEGWYYSVEATSPSEDGKVFIIGRNMQPRMNTTKSGEVSISLEPNDRLREIEVPVKTSRLKSVGVYFTVKTVDGEPILIYFPSEREVITHMLHASDTTTSSSSLVRK